MESKKYCVYCHTNKINNKKYIGITNNTKRRWRCCGIEYRPDKGRNQNVAFWNAIQKYGWDNFQHEIIASDLTMNEAKELEKFYIEKYKTFIGYFNSKKDRKGYNSTLGGDGTEGLCGELHHNFGTHISEEQKQRLREVHSKEIYEYSYTGKFIKKWRSSKEACEFYNIDSKNMWELLNGKRKTMKNRVFRYSQDSFEKYDVVQIILSGENHPMYGRNHSQESIQKMKEHRSGKCSGKNNYRAKAVMCDGHSFGCIRECAEYLNIPYTTLTSWLQGRNPIPEIYEQRGLTVINKVS